LGQKTGTEAGGSDDSFSDRFMHVISVPLKPLA
jgi:hypothetical protein